MEGDEEVGGLRPGERAEDAGEGGLDAVAAVLARHGVAGRRLRQAVARLTEGAHTPDELIRAYALPRRAVEALLRAAGSDVDRRAGHYAIRPDRTEDYRARFGYAQLTGSALTDPLADRLAAHAGVVAALAEDIASAPAARANLDHVAATAETLVRRALWLDATFDLAGARLLCVGDHDLTSLALGAIVPGLAVSVVDVDDRLLEYLDSRAARYGYDIRCRYADFRFGLPETEAGSADLVFTDPPYTPDGVALFLGRGLAGLADRTNGALIMAYGFSPAHPALGLKVQRAVQDLDLAIEVILPAFNRYHGAQAIGSASDLYVCRPTARTWQILDRKLARAAVHIYTHGAQSAEGGRELDRDVAEATVRLATGAGDTVVLAGDGWPDPLRQKETISLDTLLGAGVPSAVARRRPLRLAVNLAADPGSWLARCLLATNADQLALLVPNNHPDLANESGQRALTALVAGKYSLRLLRTTPTSRYAIVVATVNAEGDAESGARRYLLTHAHGKIGNIWREALIQCGASGSTGTLTRNEARAVVAATVSHPEWLESTLLDLPRHAIRTLLSEIDSSMTATRP